MTMNDSAGSGRGATLTYRAAAAPGAEEVR
jgi:hypothetical protein